MKNKEIFDILLSKPVFYNPDIRIKPESLIEVIIVPSSVSTIKSKSISNLMYLKKVEFESPSSIQIIEDGAFSKCVLLEEITLPTTLTTIGCKAFEGCKSLKKMTIPSSVIQFEDYVFSKCSSLKQVIFENTSMKSINTGTFNECSSLEEFEIPSFVTSIQAFAFDGKNYFY